MQMIINYAGGTYNIPSRKHTLKKMLCCKRNEQDETILCNKKKKAQLGNLNYYLTGMPPEMRKRTQIGM
jgi:hypothetical protein